MRKIFLAIIAMSFLFPLQAYAVGTCTEEMRDLSPGVKVLEFTCTPDAVDGSFPYTTSTKNIEGYVFMVVTNPGPRPLTNGYDIWLADSHDLEITGQRLLDRDEIATQLVVPLVDTAAGLYGSRYVGSKLYLQITNNVSINTVVVISVYISY